MWIYTHKNYNLLEQTAWTEHIFVVFIYLRRFMLKTDSKEDKKKIKLLQ